VSQVEGSVSLSHDDALATSDQSSKGDDKVCDLCSSSTVPADDVATSTPQKRRISPTHITIDDSIAVSHNSDTEKPIDTPTSPKDGTGAPRGHVFSKRAGVTPSTPPIKEPRSKKSPPLSDERPKRKGCCVIV